MELRFFLTRGEKNDPCSKLHATETIRHCVPRYNFWCSLSFWCPGNCDPPPTLSFAAPVNITTLTETHFETGTTLKYTCRPGYARSHSDQMLTCNSDGQWTYTTFCVREYQHLFFSFVLFLSLETKFSESLVTKKTVCQLLISMYILVAFFEK